MIRSSSDPEPLVIAAMLLAAFTTTGRLAGTSAARRRDGLLTSRRITYRLAQLLKGLRPKLWRFIRRTKETPNTPDRRHFREGSGGDAEVLVIVELLLAAVATAGALAGAYYAARTARLEEQARRNAISAAFTRAQQGITRLRAVTDSFAQLLDQHGLGGAPLRMGATGFAQRREPIDELRYKEIFEEAIDIVRDMSSSMIELSSLLDEEDARYFEGILRDLELPLIEIRFRGEYFVFVIELSRLVGRLQEVMEPIREKYRR